MSYDGDGNWLDDDYRMVTLVDRTGKGGPIKLVDGRTLPGEIWYDHRPYVVTKKPMTWRAPVALFALRHGSRLWLHTKDGEYVCRLGVQDAPDDVLAEIGPEALDCAPIEPDLESVEHWDTGAVDPARAETVKARVRRMKVPTSELRQMETAGARATAEKG